MPYEAIIFVSFATAAFSTLALSIVHAQRVTVAIPARRR